jgi:excisionase family DNA binding protein
MTLGLDAEALSEVIREEVGRALERDARQVSPWLTAPEAADYLRCPVSRIRKLTSVRAIPVHKEGRRALYRRDELDRFVEAGGWSG